MGAALVLAASGTLYTRIGVTGLFEALTFSGRAIGAVIFVCAMAILAGSFGIGLLFVLALLRRSLSPATTSVVGGAVIAGAATSAVLSALLFLIQAAALNFSAWLAVWAAMAFAAGLILTFAIKARLPVPSFKRVAGGLSVGLLVSLASFVYSDFYLPSAGQPLLTVSVSINKASVDTKSGTATIPISITIRNEQTIGAYVLASYFDVAGRRFTGISSPTQASEDEAAVQNQTFSSVGNSYSYDLIQESPLDGGGGYFLNPGEVFTASDDVTISAPTPYDAIQVSYRMVIMRDDRFEVSAGYSKNFLSGADAGQAMPSWVGQASPAGPGIIASAGAVYADSYLLNLINPPEDAYVWYQLPPLSSTTSYFPNLVGTICPPQDRATGPTAQQVLARQNLYGLQREGGGEPSTALPSQLGIPVSG